MIYLSRSMPITSCQGSSGFVTFLNERKGNMHTKILCPISSKTCAANNGELVVKSRTNFTRPYKDT